MKTKILIAAVMFFALSVAAFAQVTAQFTVGSVPVTTVSSCGVTERTGDVIFTTVTGTGAVATGTFTINYGVPITSPLANIQATGTANGVALTTGAGNNLYLDPTLNTSGPTGSLAAGLLTLSINPGAGLTNPVSFTVNGVRVNVSGSSLTSLSATISSTGNAIVAGQTTVIVISAISTALDTVTVNNPGGVTVLLPFGPALSTGVAVNAATAGITGGGVVTANSNTANILVKEKFVTAFEVPGSGGTGAVVQLIFTAVPTGVTVALPLTVTSDKGYGFKAVSLTTTTTGAITATTDATVAPSFTSLSTSLSAYYLATTPGATSANGIDTLVFQATVTADPTKVPLTPTAITVTAQMAPSNPTGSTYIPRYSGTQCAVGPATLASVATGQTFLMMTYAVNTGGFDSGIAIANTTSDPLAATLTAAKQNGTITFTFFPQATTATPAPVSFSYTTSATSPGTGLVSVC